MTFDRIKKSWLYKNRVLILGVLIVVMTHVITMLTRNSGPLGEYVYKSGDNQKQILGLVAEIRRKIIVGESPFYTWNILGGMDFYLSFASGITNIYTMILCLFPYRYFNDVSDILVVLHSVGMFLSVRYYLLNRESGKRIEKYSPEVLLFAVPYALLTEFHNRSFSAPQLIAYILMPLVILGLERIVYNKGCKLYIVSLSLLMIQNTYLGFIGCMFIVLYYLTLKFDNFKSFACTSLKVLGLSTVSVMTSAFYFIPQLIVSNSGGYGFSSYKGPGFYVNWLKILDEAMWGTPMIGSGSVDKYWECNLYIGSLILMLAFSYFSIRKINIFDRIRKLAALLILLLCINESTCNYVIHLFHYTHGQPNRHSIYLMFYLIVLAADTYCYYTGRLKKKDKIWFILTNCALVTIMIISGIYNGKERVVSYVVSVVLIVIYALALIAKRQIKFTVWSRIIVTVLIIEISANYFFVSYPGIEDVFSNTESRNLELAVKSINDHEPYRSTFNTWYRGDNLGCVYGYKTCSGFSGSANLGYLDMIKMLGANGSDIAVTESGFNSFMNAIYARKYMFKSSIKQKGIVSKDDAPFVDADSKTNGSITVYDNLKCITPIMFAEGNMEEFNNYVESGDSSKDDISSVNSTLCNSLTNVNDIMLTENVDFRINKKVNCDASIKGDVLTAKYIYEGTLEDYVNIEIEFEIPKDGEYLISDLYNWNIGYREAGDKVKFIVGVPKSEFKNDTFECRLKVSRLDSNRWEEAYRILEKNQMSIEAFEAGYVKGDIACDKEGTVFTTIPYDGSWEVVVDGNRVATKCVGNSFLTFDVDKGEHEIEMAYKTKGAEIGIMLSIISLLLMILLVAFDICKERKIPLSF